jgi:hypothetical protein
MATGAAAAVAKARRDVQHHFFSEDAVQPNRAVAFEAYSRLQQRQFERMRSRGVIREAAPGRYWLDVVAYDIDMRERFVRVRLVLLVMLVALLVGLAASLTIR